MLSNIFKWFTLQEDMTVPRISWFVKQFEPTDFDGIDRMMVAFLHYCSWLCIPAERKYMQTFLQVDGKRAVREYHVRLDMVEGFDYNEPAAFEEAYRVIVATSLQAYDTYLTVDLDGHLFKVDMSAFMTTEKSEATRKVMAENFPKLGEGSDVDDVIDSIQADLGSIQRKYDRKYLDKLDFLTGNAASRGEETLDFLFHTGIPCIDGDIGGAFTRQVWAFTGQPGAGKTRFAMAHFAYRAAVVGKLDVLVDELELSEMEIKNMLVAHHIVYLYGQKIKIPDSLMNKGQLTAEQKRIYEAAKMDLFESGKYGKIMIRTDSLVVEDIQKDIMSIARMNRNFKVWIVDYAGLVESHPLDKYARRLDEYERIAELYKTGKKVVKDANLFMLVLNQFTKEGILAATAGKTIVAGMVQGGQIVERHADYDFYMTMTEEEEIANMCSMSTLKKRGATGFKNIPFTKDLSVSIYRQVKESVS